MLVRFVTALFKGMDYAADEHYDEVAQWVADLLAIDYETAYNQRGDAEWLTGEEVYNGIADGTVERLLRAAAGAHDRQPDSTVDRDCPR